MRVDIMWKWYDLWVGLYIDTKDDCLYICPLPTVVIRIHAPDFWKWRKVIRPICPHWWEPFLEGRTQLYTCRICWDAEYRPAAARAEDGGG